MKENDIKTERWLASNILDVSELVNTYQMTSTVLGTVNNTKEALCNTKLHTLKEGLSCEKVR